MFFTCCGNITDIRIARSLQEIVQDIFHPKYTYYRRIFENKVRLGTNNSSGFSLDNFVDAHYRDFETFLLSGNCPCVWFQDGSTKIPRKLPKGEVAAVAKSMGLC